MTAPALKIFVGMLIVVAIGLPWVLLLNHREPGFLLRLFSDAQQHLEHGAEGHGGPPGYHLATIWFTYFPWCLLLPLAIGSAWENRREPPVRFALAAAIGPWIMLETVVQTKLPHYMLATFPALAFLTADAVIRSLAGERHELRSWGIVNGSIVVAMVMALCGAAPMGCGAMVRPRTLLGDGACDAGLPWMRAVVAALFIRRHPVPALLMTGVAMFAMAATWFGIYLPRADYLRLSPLAAEVLVDHGATGRGDVYMVDYKEPSLAFYQGGCARESPRMSALVTKGYVSEWSPWMVITRDVWDRTPLNARDHLEVIRTFRGLAISDGMRVVELMLVRTKAR